MNFKIIVAVLLTLFYSATCEKQDFEDGYHKKAVKNNFKKVGKFDEENGTRKKRRAQKLSREIKSIKLMKSYTLP